MMNRSFYDSKQWKEVRTKVKQRDRYRCVICGGRGKFMTVDHIKPFKNFPDLAFDINNLRTLCKSCDNKRHSEKARKTPRPTVGADGYNV